MKKSSSHAPSFWGRVLPWLLVVVIPMWLIAVVTEILDARLLERERTPVVGRMEKAEWIHGRKSGDRLMFDAVWTHEGKEYRKEFRLPYAKGMQFMDKEGRVFETQLAMHYAPSKPEVGELDIMPPDPVWVSIIIACVGFLVLCGVVGFLIYEKLPMRRRA